MTNTPGGRLYLQPDDDENNRPEVGDENNLTNEIRKEILASFDRRGKDSRTDFDSNSIVAKISDFQVP